MTDLGGDVVLSLPPRSSHLRIARLTASSFAADLGFGLDDTEDLRVAVTELCGALLDDDGDDGDGPDRAALPGRRRQRGGRGSPTRAWTGHCPSWTPSPASCWR